MAGRGWPAFRGGFGPATGRSESCGYQRSNNPGLETLTCPLIATGLAARATRVSPTSRSRSSILCLRDPRLAHQGTAGSEATEQDVLTFGRQHVAPDEVPASVTFVDRLPRNSVGKLDRPYRRAVTSPSQRPLDGVVVPNGLP